MASAPSKLPSRDKDSSWRPFHRKRRRSHLPPEASTFANSTSKPIEVVKLSVLNWRQEIHRTSCRICTFLEYGNSHITKPHPLWSHLSITGPGPPSSPAIAVSLETATSSTTTVLHSSQSASQTPPGRTTAATSQAQRAYTVDEPATSPACLPFRKLRPHQPVSLMPTAAWLTSAVPVPAAEQTTLSPPIKQKIVTKHPKNGAGTSEQFPEVSLAQPSSAMLDGAPATSMALLTN